MRHRDKIKKFRRRRNQRRALTTSLAVSLLKHGRVSTTEVKAKALRRFIEPLVTRARRNDLASRRLLLARLRLPRRSAAADKLFAEIAPRYQKRPGGYTRITKMPPRRSDAARLAIIEFV